MRPFGRIALALCAAACVAACTEVVDLTTDSRYGQYNRATDWAKNEAILLNIARASQYQPLNFLIYNAYTGSATVSAAASSPSFIIGPARTNSQKQYTFSQGALTANAMANGTINVQNLDTQDFYDALLSPVDYVNLYEFQRQGYARELLFRLFTDYVSLKPTTAAQNKYSTIIFNDTSDEKQCSLVPPVISRALYGHPLQPGGDRICFNDLVFFALLSGLSSEVRPIAQAANSASSSGATQGKTAATSSSSSSAPKSPTSEGRLCFDAAIANRAQAEYESITHVQLPAALKNARYSPVCGTWSAASTAAKKGAQSSANTSSGVQKLSVSVTGKTQLLIWDIHTLGEMSVEVGTRSTFAIYNYLGKLLRQQNAEVNQFLDPTSDDKQVLTVNQGQPAGCFVAATLDLGLYCVPLDGAQNTKRTFSILSQLLALKTTTGDLQLQPVLRLLPQ